MERERGGSCNTCRWFSSDECYSQSSSRSWNLSSFPFEKCAVFFSLALQIDLPCLKNLLEFHMRIRFPKGHTAIVRQMVSTYWNRKFITWLDGMYGESSQWNLGILRWRLWFQENNPNEHFNKPGDGYCSEQYIDIQQLIMLLRENSRIGKISQWWISCKIGFPLYVEESFKWGGEELCIACLATCSGEDQVTLLNVIVSRSFSTPGVMLKF